MQNGRRFYYDVVTGEIIFDAGNHDSLLPRRTIEEDIKAFKVLSDRNRESFDVIELDLEAYQVDFNEGVLLTVDPETKELRFEYPNPENPAEPITPAVPLSKQIEELKAVLTSNSEKYDALDKENTSIEKLATARVLKLKEECTAAIYEGFLSGENFFGYNEQDQANFAKRLATIAVGAEGPFEWKSKNNGVVELTLEEFIQVITDAEAHQLKHQKKYWALEAEILNADTNEAVDAIKW